MILPQELEVFYVIPAIRKELAKALVSKGVTQRKIASIFGVTEACVSNYFNTKRGSEVKFTLEIKKLINSSADLIIQEKTCFINVIQQVCKKFKNTDALCHLHKKIDKLTCNCGACLA